MSTTDPQLWLRQQDPNSSLRDLWPSLLREAWAERHETARESIDSIDLTTLLGWAAANDATLSETLVRVILSAHETEPTDAAHAEKRRKDAADAVKQLAPPVSDARSELLTKLQRISDDRGLDLLDLFVETKTSNNLLSFIQKNATKGLKYEKTAAAFVELHRPNVRVLQLADKDTKLSIRFDRDGKAYLDTPADPDRFSKDADLGAVVQTSDTEAVLFLVSHKFARVAGGHQDNQWADASTFLDYACRCDPAADTPLSQLQELARAALGVSDLTITWRPALILDGDYFSEAPARMSATFNGQPCFIGDTDGFIRHVDNLTGTP